MAVFISWSAASRSNKDSRTCESTLRRMWTNRRLLRRAAPAVFELRSLPRCSTIPPMRLPSGLLSRLLTGAVLLGALGALFLLAGSRDCFRGGALSQGHLDRALRAPRAPTQGSGPPVRCLWLRSFSDGLFPNRTCGHVADVRLSSGVLSILSVNSQIRSCELRRLF